MGQREVEREARRAQLRHHGHAHAVQRGQDILLEADEPLPVLLATVTTDVLQSDFSLLAGSQSAPGLTIEDIVSRETVPLLVRHPCCNGRALGLRDGFFDVAASLAAAYGLPPAPRGRAFLPNLRG